MTIWPKTHGTKRLRAHSDGRLTIRLKVKNRGFYWKRVIDARLVTRPASCWLMKYLVFLTSRAPSSGDNSTSLLRLTMLPKDPQLKLSKWEVNSKFQSNDHKLSDSQCSRSPHTVRNTRSCNRSAKTIKNSLTHLLGTSLNWLSRLK